MTPALRRYLELLDELLWRRGLSSLPDDEEERYAERLNDLRHLMEETEERGLDALVANRLASARRDEDFGALVDAMPQDFPLRKAC
jgi:hypothetical protein